MAEVLPSNKSLGQMTTPLKPIIDANTSRGNPPDQTPEINLTCTWLIRPSPDCQPGQ